MNRRKVIQTIASIAAFSATFKSNAAGTAVKKLLTTQGSKIFNVQEFGAIADGVTDCYQAFQAAFSALQANGGGVLQIPLGHYFINQHKVSGGTGANGITDFVLKGLVGVVIDGCGSTILMQGGWARTADYTSGKFTFSYHNCICFGFVSCKSLIVKNLTIDGGASTITKVANAEGASNGLYFCGGEHNTIENVTVQNYCADGLYITQAGPRTAFIVEKYFTAKNCIFRQNARNNLSIIQLRWANFVNCEFSYAGNSAYGGHSPQAGVDVEPNYASDLPTSPYFFAGDQSTGDINFSNCIFKNNKGFQFVSSSDLKTKYPVTLSDSTFINTTNSRSQVAPASALTKFVSCHFENVAWYPSYTANTLCTTEFTNCSLNWGIADSYGILFIEPKATVKITGCDIKFLGVSPRTRQMINVAGNIFLRNNSIFISKALHAGKTYDFPFLIQKGADSRNNHWSTDLSTQGKFFSIGYAGAKFVDDVIVNPAFMSNKAQITGLTRISFGTQTNDSL